MKPSSRLALETGGYIGVSPDVTGDPYWDSAVLCLRCDGTNGSTTFTDLSPAGNGNPTVSGTAAVSNAQSLFYGASLVVNGDSNYLNYSSRSNFGLTGDFMIDCWTYPVTVSGGGSILFDFRAVNGSGLLCYANSTGIAVQAGTSTQTASSATVLATGGWRHLRFSRVGGLIAAHYNGAVVASYSGFDNSGIASSLPLTIGRHVDTGGFGYTGYFQDIRVYKGVGLIGNYTPPPRPFMARRYPSGVFTL